MQKIYIDIEKERKSWKKLLKIFRLSCFAYLKVIIFSSFFLSSLISYSQKEGNIWYFGNRAGLDFNNCNGAPTALTEGIMEQTEGCSSIADSLGNLLFYTDGTGVWNRNHVIMPNGFGLMGDFSSTQSALIVQKPGSNTIYYIFTTPAEVQDFGNIGFRYSVVDMTLDGGLGDVIASGKNTMLHHPAPEKVTAVRHANGCDIWVISHLFGTNNFHAYLVTNMGVTHTPVVSSAGSIHTVNQVTNPPRIQYKNAIGQLKVSSDGSKLAAAILFDGIIELFDFNNLTGLVYNPISFLGLPSAYGVEFSPDGTKLYGSLITSGQIYQWDVMAGLPLDIINSRTLVASSSKTSSLQLATDGKIYVAKINSNYIGAINNPNVAGTACNYVDNAVFLNGKQSRAGLPNIMQSHFYSQFIFDQICFGDPTSFFITDAGIADSVSWDFGDPTSGGLNTSTDLNPVHLFSAPGIYNVKLTKHALCGSTVFYRTVCIYDGAPPFDLGNDTILCMGQTLTLSANLSGSNVYLWQDGSMLSSFTVSSPGIYWVEVTHDCGSARDSITISANIISLETDSTSASCFGESDGTATVHVSGDFPDYTYLWDDPNAQITATATGLPAGVYHVTVTDAIGCTKDTAVTISQPPALIINTSTTSVSCNGGSEGTATVTVSGGYSGYSYLWNDPGTQDTNTATGLPAGVYHVTVTDATGCTKDTAVTVSQPLALIVIPNVTPVSCKGEDNGSAIVTVNGGTSPYFYSWSPAVSSNDTAVNLSPGNYTVTVSDNNNCSHFAVFTVPEPDLLTLQASGVNTICKGQSTTLSAIAQGGTAPYTYTWEPIALSNSSINVSPSVTTPYTVTVHDINNCTAGPQSITVNVKPLPVVTFTTDIDSGCAPHCVAFNNTTPNTSTINWEFGDGQLASGPGAYHCYTQPGSYSVTLDVTGNNGCSNSLSIPGLIKVFPNPVAGFSMTPSHSVPVSSSIAFNDESIGAVHWFWLFGDFQNSSSELKDPIYSYNKLGSHIVTLTVKSNKGCTDTISHTIQVEPEFSFYIPNAFTPDNDGINDFFGPKGAEFYSFEMVIYNRWGEKIYHTTEIDRLWDGRHKDGNELMKQDVYVYKIWVKDFKEEIHYYVGNVTLIR